MGGVIGEEFVVFVLFPWDLIEVGIHSEEYLGSLLIRICR